ncbi:MAG: aminopeptidase [Burkholderiaceae bacterium]|nr:aminopeptidase [Burkholderiaceae bacterium]MDO9089567.1 aminopeptidase [Burkholderiaceae bacterium]MDP1968851.1 aminopeptidase [Burkholderiaceae bacterium]
MSLGRTTVSLVLALGRRPWGAAVLVIGAVLLSLGGCADTRYYWQSVSGHMHMLTAARPVNDWLADTATPAELRERLRLGQRVRRFAVEALHLPDNPSYRRYAELGRPAAVWNVVAAPEYSLTLKTWCFPVAGCVGYRGYFDQAEAQTEAAALRAAGLEASVYGVPAYSTLGWMNWAGGDPLLSTFIRYPESEFARLLFHELAHQVVYVSGDTAFNESYATAVERLGTAQWLKTQASPQSLAMHERIEQRRAQFRALTQATRRELEALYRAMPADVAARKRAILQSFRDNYAALKVQWGGFAGYDAWVAQANNASFGAQAAYDDGVPAFEALFLREGGDWTRFHAAVRQLAALAPAPRRQALEALRISSGIR